VHHISGRVRRADAEGIGDDERTVDGDVHRLPHHLPAAGQLQPDPGADGPAGVPVVGPQPTGIDVPRRGGPPVEQQAELVEDGGLDAAAEPYVDAMMTASPVGLRLSKECLNMSVDAGSIEAVIAMEDRNQILCSRSEEFSEGIRAFLEKRKPVYIKR
jgi:hypothetical protein